MCNNCNCDNYNKCSIVGYLPIGFCCSYCIIYDEHHICLNIEKTTQEEAEEIKLISSSIEKNLLRVVIKQKGKEIPIYIDLKKQLGMK